MIELLSSWNMSIDNIVSWFDWISLKVNSLYLYICLAFKELDIMEKNFVHAVNAIREYSETKRIPESMLKRLKSTAQHIEQLDTL